MPPEILALIGQPLLLIAILAVGAVLGIGVERLVEGQKRAMRRAYWQGRNTGKRTAKSPPVRKGSDANLAKMFGVATDDVASAKGTSATDQLACVMDAAFTSRPLLNRPEATLFKALDAAVIARNPGWQVMAQVSLGEFLASPDKDAY